MQKNIHPPADLPVYFLNLIVENMRCFGERQVLNLSDSAGKPAQWTVILGDNGTGKTTLLKCLAGLELADAFSGSAEEPDQKKRTRLPK
ncbi:MAG: AAA family ATPase, partial [Gammaproteobacteria bacterium]|nr:AAA family ATPase [Gammaproteobacteria bacterium]